MKYVMMSPITTVTVKLIVLIPPVPVILPVCLNSAQIILTGEAVKPIPAAVGAAKIKNVLNLWSPMLNQNVMQLAAVGTKRKKPVRSGRKIFRKNSSTDLHFFLKVYKKAGPAMALPFCFHVPQTIMQHKKIDWHHRQDCHWTWQLPRRLKIFSTWAGNAGCNS